MLLGQGARPLPDLVVQQQLAAGRREQAVLGRLKGALVGHLEPADLLDRVAPELQPQRMLLGRREHVEQPAAHGHLAALLHHVHAVVTVGDQVGDDLVEVGVVTGAQPDGLKVAEALHDRLQQCPDRRHDHAERPGGGVALDRVGQPAQHRQPLPDGVGARREPLVRQRLPGREHRHGAGLDEAGQRGGEVFRLTPGRGDGQHGALVVPGQRGHAERAQRGRRDQRDVAALFESGGQFRVGANKVK